MSLHGRGIGLASVLFLACAWAAPAQAGILNLNGAAMPGWTGTEHFAGSGTQGSLDADVDYAVFSPGTYPGSISTSAGEYVYAYQIFALDDATLPVGTLTVGVAYNSTTHANISGGHNPAYDPTYPDNTGDIPFAVSLGPTSSSFKALFDGILPDDHSAIVLFTSPNGPTLASASIQNGGVSDQEQLPSPNPVPEPATLALAGVGGGLLLIRRRRA